ncbi:ATP-grasp fold amidoligase family protein, partial [Enterobacter asburiae]|uniref:ATP-grasp fold amidoligase family protein n=1 Tax=Enterobacter asburiae TaxID=61645 RepID=UPI00256EDBDB
DRNRSHWSTSKTPSYTKSVSWQHHPPGEPLLFRQALLASQELAHGIDYCRVDLMLKKDEIYFSEITLSPRRGKLTITPQEWDAKLGKIWHLSPAGTFDLPLKLTRRAR